MQHSTQTQIVLQYTKFENIKIIKNNYKKAQMPRSRRDKRTNPYIGLHTTG